jgi:hypothetical protein
MRSANFNADAGDLSALKNSYAFEEIRQSADNENS